MSFIKKAKCANTYIITKKNMSDKELLDEIISLTEKLRMENKQLKAELKYKRELYEHLNKI